MPTILITGANRGIGLEFTRQYSAAGWQVIAANRTPFTPEDLAQFGHNAREIYYDALDDGSAQELAIGLSGTPVDVVLLNAGTGSGPDLLPEDVRVGDWRDLMLTNTYAPLHLAALLEPNLKLGRRKVLAAISSIAASMSQYRVPRQFAYRASKAALNQMWRNLSVEWKDWGCITLALSPGQVKTRITGFQGHLDPAASVTGMRRVIDNATPEQSGFHWSYSGEVVPW